MKIAMIVPNQQYQLLAFQERLNEEARTQEDETTSGFNYRIKRWLSLTHDYGAIIPG